MVDASCPGGTPPFDDSSAVGRQRPSLGASRMKAREFTESRRPISFASSSLRNPANSPPWPLLIAARPCTATGRINASAAAGAAAPRRRSA